MCKNKNDLIILLNSDYLNTCSVVYMMVLIRKLLEENNQKKILKKLNFYCNWTVHSNLSIDESCQSFLLELTHILERLPFLDKYKLAEDGGYIWNGDEALNNEIDNVLGLDNLRKEINGLFQNLNIPIETINNNEKWHQFCDILCQHLVGQKIMAPNKIKERQVMSFSLVYNDAPIPEILRKSREAYKIFFELETNSYNNPSEYFVGPFWIPKK